MRRSRTGWVVVVLASGAWLGCSSGGQPVTSPPDTGVDAHPHDAGHKETGPVQHDAGHEAGDAGCRLTPPCNACLASDPENCGACGHSCGAVGTCSAGLCSRTIATGQGTQPNVVNDIIVDDTNVYWIPASQMNAGMIATAPKDGGPLTTLATGILQPEGLTQDTTNLYFVSHNFGILVLGKTGGQSPSTLFRDGLLDAGFYPEYWLTLATPNLFYVGGLGINIYELALDGGTVPTQITTSVSLLGSPGTGYNALAVDDAGIYYDSTNQIVTLSRATNAVTATLSGSYGPTLAIDEGFIYFISNAADGGSGTSLVRAAKGGGTPTVVSSTDVGSDDGPIAVDATNVYWTHVPNAATLAGVVVSAPKAGGAITTVATDCYGHCPFALDATNIYWPAGDGTIRSAPKAP